VVSDLSDISRRNTQLDADLQSALLANVSLGREKQILAERLNIALGSVDGVVLASREDGVIDAYQFEGHFLPERSPWRTAGPANAEIPDR
jgi:hypothetical protein